MIIVNGEKYKKKKYGITIVDGKYYGNGGRYPLGAETQAIVSRAQWEGFAVPPQETLVAMDIHIQNLKNMGVWTKLDTYYQFAYADTAYANFSRIDWKRPMNSTLGLPSGTLLYTINGWEGNGVDAYFNTQYNASTQAVNFTLNNASATATVYKAFVIGNAFHIFGNSNGNIRIQNRSALQQTLNGGTLASGQANMSGTGMKSINRDDATNLRLFNGATALTNTAASTSIANNVMFIFALSATQSFSDVGVSNFLMGASLTNTDYNNLRASYNRFLTTISLGSYA